MLSRVVRNSAPLIGSTFILLVCVTEAFENTYPALFGNTIDNELRRNPKFIIPSLLGHIYQKLDGGGESGFSMPFVLTRPRQALSGCCSKKGSKETAPNKKENPDSAVEHRTIVGSHRKDHLSQQKTKTPSPKPKDVNESLPKDASDGQSKNANEGQPKNAYEGQPRDNNVQSEDANGSKSEETTDSPIVQAYPTKSGQQDNKEEDANRKDDEIHEETNDIQVKKGFSSYNKNWYGDSSVVWPQPIYYPNSYAYPFNHPVNAQGFKNYYRLKQPAPIGNEQFQEGRAHEPHPALGPLYPRQTFKNLYMTGLKSQPNFWINEASPNVPSDNVGRFRDQWETNWFDNKNVLSQEKKFVVTNVTKYVLDFYCPHCGGEISVSRGKNRGLLNRGDDVTINKGRTRGKK